MYAKLYSALYAVFLAASALMLVTGYFTAMVAVVLGFIAFGIVFMGMISVLPATVVHHVPAPKSTAPGRIETVVGNTSEAIRKLGADIVASSTVEIRKPKFP